QVILPVANGGARQVPGYFPQVGLQNLVNRAFGFGLFGENDLPDNSIDIGIRQLNTDSEAPFEFLQIAGAGYRCLAGANEEQLATEVFTAGLDCFLYRNGALAVFTNELLNFVQYDQGKREFAVCGQCLANGLEHIVAGNVLNERIQVVQG